MITNKILQTVFRIICGNSLGSAFTIENGETQYIVTAKHLFEIMSFPSESDISILRNGRYESYHVRIYYHKNSNVDAVVLKTVPYIQIAPFFNNMLTVEGLILGQDVFFLGFPYDYESLVTNLPGERTPTPFVKKACVSGITAGNKTLFLDGINNPGFSGGPVCFTKPGKNDYQIAGVINSYRFDRKELFAPGDKSTGFYFRENTGIINVCNIMQVLSIIEDNDL